ncbi:LPS-assembly lipoprotein LptE [Glaciimonas sp. GG7]
MTRISNSRLPFFRWSIIIATATLLAACGFHLRGAVTLPFKSIYLGSATATPLGIELKRNIIASGTTIVLDKEQGAEAIMEVLSQSQQKVILALNSQGRAREYMLYSKFSFRIRDAQQKELMAPTEITLKRDISYSESQELSKIPEEALLYRDMQTDLVRQILRRLAAIKPAEKNSNVVPVVIPPGTSVPSTTPPAPPAQ